MKVYSLTKSFHKEGIKQLEKAGLEFVMHPENAHVKGNELKKVFLESYILIMGIHDHLEKEWLKEIKGPKVLATLSIGLDHIDEAFFKDSRITVVHCVFGNTISVAEHILGLILALNKNIFTSYQYVLNERKEAYETKPREITGKTIGMIGAGHITQKLLELTMPFHFKTLIYTAHPEHHQDLLKYGVTFVSLDELLKTSDIISVHVPSSPSTKNMLSKEKLGLIRKNATVINASRLDVVDTQELLTLADQNPCMRVGLDVDIKTYQKEFQKKRDNVLITPHIAALSQSSSNKMQLEIVEKILKVLKSERI